MGSATIDVSQNAGKLLVPVVMDSADRKIKVSIPQDTLFRKKADGLAYESTIAPPTEYGVSEIQKKFANQTIIKAFKM